MYNNYRNHTRPTTIVQEGSGPTPMPKKRRDWEDAILKFARNDASSVFTKLSFNTLSIPPLKFNLDTSRAATNIKDDGTVEDIVFASDWAKKQSLEVVVQVFFMELGNVRNAIALKALDKPLRANQKAWRKLDDDAQMVKARAYARSLEAIEWSHLKQLLPAIDSAEVFASTRTDLFKTRPTTFEAYNEIQLKNNHSQGYMLEWFSIVGAIVPKELEEEIDANERRMRS